MQESDQKLHMPLNKRQNTPKKRQITPDYTHEKDSLHPVCGIDEAGRGPLAGPVVAAAVILDPSNIPQGLNDSKVLSQSAREYLLNKIWETADVGIGISEPEEIDRKNILWASMLAMSRAVTQLKTTPSHALIDGNRCPKLPPNMTAEALIKGDSRSVSIAAASIIAKVTRDNLMALADMRYPQYGFQNHKGYATAAHRAAIAEHGPCPIHRFSFAPMRQGELFWSTP